MKFLLYMLLAAPVLFGAPTVTYSKEFKGAVPPLFSIELHRDGSAVYKEENPDDDPISFKLTSDLTETIFNHVSKIDNGKRTLESGLKVANMGKKTIRFEDGATKNEVTFNYSQDLDAQALADIFDKMAETQQHILSLESALRFDKLGINKVLLQIETAWDRKRLIGYERIIPLLDRIAANQSYLNIARERAGKLAEIFRNPPTRNEETKHK